MCGYTDNDKEIARRILFSYCLDDAMRAGIGGIGLGCESKSSSCARKPAEHIDSDFSFIYYMTGACPIDELFAIAGFIRTPEERNGFIARNRDLFCAPQLRTARNASSAFGFDYVQSVRPVLELMNWDGALDSFISQCDARE